MTYKDPILRSLAALFTITMNHDRRLAAIRSIHTAIYLIMAMSSLVILYAGLTGARGTWLWAAMALMSVEVAVFVGDGLKCPLTTQAVKYGARSGHVFDTFLPERFTRYTFRVFGSLLFVGLSLIALPWLLAR